MLLGRRIHAPSATQRRCGIPSAAPPSLPTKPTIPPWKEPPIELSAARSRSAPNRSCCTELLCTVGCRGGISPRAQPHSFLGFLHVLVRLIAASPLPV